MRYAARVSAFAYCMAVAGSAFTACEGFGGPNMRMLCLGEEVERLDDLVKQAYEEALAKVESPEMLKLEQEAWREGRDPGCTATSSASGEYWEECRVNSTEQRLYELNSILSGTCGPPSHFCLPLRRR
jgi:uncharacterized protein YecT (DUF1311 family)